MRVCVVAYGVLALGRAFMASVSVCVGKWMGGTHTLGLGGRTVPVVKLLVKAVEVKGSKLPLKKPLPSNAFVKLSLETRAPIVPLQVRTVSSYVKLKKLDSHPSNTNSLLSAAKRSVKLPGKRSTFAYVMNWSLKVAAARSLMVKWVWRREPSKREKKSYSKFPFKVGTGEPAVPYSTKSVVLTNTPNSPG